MVRTRSTAAEQEVEHKLQLALEELKCSKILCEQLLQERSDSEEEVLHVVLRNTSLKDELSSLHSQLLEVTCQRDQLQNTLDCINQCHDTHEQALSRITELEYELCEAQNQITQFEQEKSCERANYTQSLYDELIDCSHLQTSQVKQIDMDLVLPMKKNKKLRKLNKFIKKANINSERLKRQIGYRCKQLKRKLVLEFEQSATKAREDYDNGIQLLNLKIINLENDLRDMTEKLYNTQSQWTEYTQVVSEMVNISASNAELTELLLNDLPADKQVAGTVNDPMLASICASAVDPTRTLRLTPTSGPIPVPEPSSATPGHSPTSPEASTPRIYIFSDGIAVPVNPGRSVVAEQLLFIASTAAGLPVC